MLNNLAAYVAETSFKIRMNLSVSLIENLTLTAEVELELQLAILLISVQHEVFCEFAPCCFTSGKKSFSSPLNERLDGPQSRFG